MNNNLWEIGNIQSDLDILKDKISDLVQSNFYITEDFFESECLEDMKAVEWFGMSYRELRIKTNQSHELLLIYQKEMAKLVKRLDEELIKIKEGDSNV
ncbi:DUF1474 family protein [Mammaliicoccus sciuri]|uniref:type II toxin-antitoxin system toxin TscT n=1 Tax=Mammaliicoccus sciuri TaxID=1296 RepID=UPI001FB31938|nr:DUF1474 family protein [Mammaliicoccus sciuri]MCJ0933549.1 DUF1474 family protein [Mammaliicoccus sciuri]